MSAGTAPSPITEQVDSLMHELYRRTRGKLHQTLVADCSVADAYRHHLDSAYPVSNRFIVRATRASWCILRMLLGRGMAARLGGVLWMLVGIPELFASALKLHADAYTRQGDAGARHVLLRTGVANEPLIAHWVANREQAAVVLLQYNITAKNRLSGLRHLPSLLETHVRLCLNAISEISRLVRESIYAAQELDALMPAWFVLIARRATSISWNHCWAKSYLANEADSLWFTMNYAIENAFRVALPSVPAAYVEHGFPRRDIPPLPCRQYVYSKGYADYLKGFDADLGVDVIGLDYFDHGEIEPTRTIVVVSLQDWPQFKIERVRNRFNAALEQARRTGWKLLFRTRHYDSDAFAQALNGPWDDVSMAADETFQQCLTRHRPAMVWTTWSTAVLDARARGIIPIAFVTPDLDEYFVSDLDQFSYVVCSDDSLRQLHDCLKWASTDAVMDQLGIAMGGIRSAVLTQACN